MTKYYDDGGYKFVRSELHWAQSRIETMGYEIDQQQKRIDELETLLNNLAIATNNYRNYHDLYGKGDLRTGRAWDEMARYERKAIYGLEGQNND